MLKFLPNLVLILKALAVPAALGQVSTSDRGRQACREPFWFLEVAITLRLKSGQKPYIVW